METIDAVGVCQVLYIHVITVATMANHGQSIFSVQLDIIGRMPVTTRRWFEIGGFRRKSVQATN